MEDVVHAPGDIRLFEKLAAVALRRDQFVKLLDLVAELDGQCIGLQLAGIADGSHGRASRMVQDETVFPQRAIIGRRALVHEPCLCYIRPV